MIKTSKSCSVPTGYKFYDYIWIPRNSGSSTDPRISKPTGSLIRLKQYSNLDLISYEFDFICSQAYPSNFNVPLLGGRSASGVTNSLACYITGQYKVMAHFHGIEQFTNLSYLLNTKTRVRYQNTSTSPSQLIVNGNSENLVWTNTVSIPNTGPHLFGNPTPNDLSSMSKSILVTVKTKISKIKVYDLNNNLINNYVPCVRKSDNVIGMYDTVENVFYTAYQTTYATIGSSNCSYEVGDYDIKKIMTKVNSSMKEVQYIKTNKLPSAYQEVGYITSNGGDYLDTGFVPNNNTKVEVKIKASQDINNIWVFGARQSAENLMYGVLLCYYNGYSPLKEIRSDYGNGNESAGGIVYYNTNKNLTQNIVTIVKDKNKFYVDGVLVGTNTAQTFTCPVNLYLFKINSANGGNHNSYINMYYAKIWDNETLIRYYIPCYRKSDNAIGMYDLVNKTFTEGVGTFTKGNDVSSMVTVYDVLPSTYTRYGYVWTPINSGSSSEPRIWRSYQALIMLKEYSNLDLIGYEFDFKSEQVYPTDYNLCLLGGRSVTGETNGVGFYITGQYKTFNMCHGGNHYTNLTYTLGVKSHIKYKNTSVSPSELIVDGSSEDLTWSNVVSIPNTKLVLFINYVKNDTGNPIQTVRVKIGTVKVYDLSGNLINNYVPCVRKSDNRIGMYDTIEGVFYTTMASSYSTMGDANCIYEVGNW
ncbi:MAG: hypothetical protein IKN65_00125 [Clostridia bacterium]|nr:hypothetical protein [Bacilli bacterium]MBR3672689.1 hypothetical protein [Clostridia bacterium]MBR4671616.1 hypothetical protein [Bacilli bacterium]